MVKNIFEVLKGGVRPKIKLSGTIRYIAHNLLLGGGITAHHTRSPKISAILVRIIFECAIWRWREKSNLLAQLDIEDKRRGMGHYIPPD
jgi:hypothetical protein